MLDHASMTGMEQASPSTTSSLAGHRVAVFGVKYTHVQLLNRDDLYLTKFGLPFLEYLLPENWLTDRAWFFRSG